MGENQPVELAEVEMGRVASTQPPNEAQVETPV